MTSAVSGLRPGAQRTETDRLAMCSECACTRTVAARWTRDRSFACEACGRRTLHAIVGTEPAWDWREIENNKPDPDRMRFMQLVEWFESHGYYVGFRDTGDPGYVSIARPLNELHLTGRTRSTFKARAVIGIRSDLSSAHKVRALRWAWRFLPPDDIWDSCTPAHDADHGLGVHVGIHRTEPAWSRQ